MAANDCSAAATASASARSIRQCPEVLLAARGSAAAPCVSDGGGPAGEPGRQLGGGRQSEWPKRTPELRRHAPRGQRLLQGKAASCLGQEEKEAVLQVLACCEVLQNDPGVHHQQWLRGTCTQEGRAGRGRGVVGGHDLLQNPAPGEGTLPSIQLPATELRVESNSVLHEPGISACAHLDCQCPWPASWRWLLAQSGSAERPAAGAGKGEGPPGRKA